MPASVIVGLQWGDEGKGKAVDLLSESVDMVVRYQGGDNAGHTVVIGDEVFKLHLVPSGVLHPHITPVIGNGVVVNPRTLISEMAMLAERGVDPSRIRVSRAAHVIMPYHVALDGAAEARLSGSEIGTTRRGIGPAYADRAWRAGVRMGDLLDARVLRARLERVLPERNAVLHESYGQPGFDLEELLEEAAPGASACAPHITDTTCSSRTPWPRVGTSSSRVPRARSSTSTTAPTRTSPAATPWPAAPAPAAAWARSRSSRSSAS